jgi:DNA-binding ferritin-like protein
MSDKDLGELVDNAEQGIEDLKEELANKEFRVFGIKMTPTTIGAAFALIGSLLGTMYAGFESYKAFQEMAEKLEVMDLEAVEARNVSIERKLEDAIDYTRDIKNSLKDDIIRIEKITERTSTRMKTVQDEIDERMRDLSQINRDMEKDVRSSMRTTEDRIEEKMEKLDKELRETLQKALDNPLSDT